MQMRQVLKQFRGWMGEVSKADLAAGAGFFSNSCNTEE
jgi:hypothetical protein